MPYITDIERVAKKCCYPGLAAINEPFNISRNLVANVA